jgi:hypothetical protein
MQSTNLPEFPAGSSMHDQRKSYHANDQHRHAQADDDHNLVIIGVVTTCHNYSVRLMNVLSASL